jgi:hypothetical protein
MIKAHTQVVLNTAYATWIGKLVQQVRATLPGTQRFLGRKATVTDVLTDELGNVHLQTDDDVWCPASLMAVIPERFIHKEVGAVVTSNGDVSLYAAGENNDGVDLNLDEVKRLHAWLGEYIASRS